MSKNKANIVAVLGASGSGKSTYIKRAIARARRLIVWDPMNEYGEKSLGITVVATLADLLKVSQGKEFRARFVPSGDPALRVKQFDLVCAIALESGRLVFVGEELKFVTSPSRAPIRWAAVTMTGRHKGLTVIGGSQRPASIDKDFLGNCTIIRTGRLVYPEDVRAVARAMQVPEDDIATLKPLDFIEKDTTTGKILRGRLEF